MRITVVYLGGSRTQAGCDREAIDVEKGTTVADVAALVGKRHPQLAPLLESVRWARNYEFAASTESLSDGDEIALLPPVAGGASRVELTEDRLDPAAIIERVASPEVGATVIFVGTVRNHARGKSVSRIEYEAYQPMAERQLERIAEACCADRPSCDVSIAHRHGDLPVGEISVVITATAPHRSDAFDACRDALERIKVDVPIWKKEHAVDGETWVGWGGG